MENKKTVEQWRRELTPKQSQKVFSDNVGINYNTYVKKETGKAPWLFDEILRICNYLDISTEQIKI